MVEKGGESFKIFKLMFRSKLTCVISNGWPGDATTTICHRYTPPEQLAVFTKTADIIVTAAGVPGLVTAEMVKEGVVVIDVGINRVADPDNPGKTKLVGDVDFAGMS